MMVVRVNDASHAPNIAVTTSEPNGTRTRWTDPVLLALVVVDLLLFLGGITTHSGIGIPLGPVVWIEPVVVPAAIVEGVGAIGLAATVASVASRAVWADRLTWWVLWYCFAGVMWGMLRLAIGSIPEARTMTNDFRYSCIGVGWPMEDTLTGPCASPDSSLRVQI